MTIEEAKAIRGKKLACGYMDFYGCPLSRKASCTDCVNHVTPDQYEEALDTLQADWENRNEE